MTIEDIKAFYYALKDVMSAGSGVPSASDKICFYMNHTNYRLLCELLGGFVDPDLIYYMDGRQTLFGHKIKIRDELKHIYVGIEMDEVEE